jgi:hypothetical protein
MKKQSIRWLSLVALFVSSSLSNQTSVAFHFMQIEQVIGGVNGDTTAQAIQLRAREDFQTSIGSASLRTVDATGENEVLLVNMNGTLANGATGDRVLITTPNFANYTDIPLVSDFTMMPIPVSYLAAGQLTFETSSGTVTYWSLSWGGTGFTGPTTGATSNDVGDEGDFGPAFGGPLPSNSLSALLFQGAAEDKSTNNFDDYALTPGAATFFNNIGTAFSLGVPFDESADFDEDDDVDGEDYLIWQRGAGGPGGLSEGDANNNGTVDAVDLDIWKTQYGTVPIQPGDFNGNGEVNGLDFLLWQRNPSVGSLADWQSNYGTGATLSASSAAVPEPTTSALALAALCLVMGRRRGF